jgi:predicted nucleic acid-binding protein
MERLFVDTSAWLALVNGADPGHQAVLAALEQFKGRIVTSNFIFDEAVTLCRVRLGHDAAKRLGDQLLANAEIDLVRLTADDERAAWTLFLARADKRYSFTDCTSFVLMRRLKIGRAAALDDDFHREGFEVVPGI